MLEEHELLALADLVRAGWRADEEIAGYKIPHLATGMTYVSRNAHFALVKVLELAKRLQSEEFLAQLAATIETSAQTVLSHRSDDIAEAFTHITIRNHDASAQDAAKPFANEIGRNAAQCVNELIATGKIA